MEDIYRALHAAMADQIVKLISRIDIQKERVKMGGVARYPALVAFIKGELQLSSLIVPNKPSYVHAL